MLAVEVASQPRRFLKRAPTQVAERLVARIKALAAEPFPADVKRVVNHHDKVYRVRVGDYRIEYIVLHRRELLLVTAINKRARSYR